MTDEIAVVTYSCKNNHVILIIIVSDRRWVWKDSTLLLPTPCVFLRLGAPKLVVESRLCYHDYKDTHSDIHTMVMFLLWKEAITGSQSPITLYIKVAVETERECDVHGAPQ